MEIELPDEIVLEGVSHGAPAWNPLTLGSLLAAVEDYSAEMIALEPSTASDPELEGAVAEALRLQLTLTGAAHVLAGTTPAGGGTPPGDGDPASLKRGGVLGGLGTAAAAIGDLKCALENADGFAADPDGAIGKCDIVTGVNTSLGAELGLRTMIEVMLNRLAAGGVRIQEVDAIAGAMADQADSDGEDAVAAAVQAYRAALDSDLYFGRSAELEGGVLTFLNGTLPDATADLLDELWLKLALLDPNSPPTLHQDLADLTTELRESALLATYQATSSPATGFAGVADDAFAYLAPIPHVGDELESLRPDIDAALAAITPSPELADAAAALLLAHSVLITDLAELDDALARERAFVAPLAGELSGGYERAEDGGKAISGAP